MDNLESQTYETFERDPIKYRNYENAIHAALVDTPPSKVSVIMVVRPRWTQDDTAADGQMGGGGGGLLPQARCRRRCSGLWCCVAWQVGAGRGPLVRRALMAGERASRAVRVYAVEKNPNAVVTLRYGGLGVLTMPPIPRVAAVCLTVTAVHSPGRDCLCDVQQPGAHDALDERHDRRVRHAEVGGAGKGTHRTTPPPPTPTHTCWNTRKHTCCWHLMNDGSLLVVH